MKRRITTEKGRYYEIEEGYFWPSVTTVLEARPLSFGLKEFFLTNTKDEAERKLNEAGLQGSKIHHTIDLIIQGEIVLPSGLTDEQLKKTKLVNDPLYGEPELLNYLKQPFSKREDTMMRGFMQFWADYKPETVMSETIIWYGDKDNPKRYAGTLDWVGRIEVAIKPKKQVQNAKTKSEEQPKRKKLLIVLDWKTGKNLYPEYEMQISAYRKALNWMKLVANGKKTRVNNAGLLQLGVNKCGYKLKIVEDLNKNFQRFSDTQRIWLDEHMGGPPSVYQFMESYQVK